jgi:enamine deaminase RidA (YjgF/YER057c/UK114 family)
MSGVTSRDQTGAVTLHSEPLGAGAAYFTLVAEGAAPAGRMAADAYRRLADALAREGMAVLHERIFCSLDACERVLAARASAMDDAGPAPVTCVQGRPAWGSGFAGASVMAVRPGAEGELSMVNDVPGRPFGRTWRTDGAAFTFLQSLHGLADGAQADNSRPAQTTRMFERAERALNALGADYASVTRTWLYVSDILSWYGDLNKARSACYRRFGLMPAASQRRILLPASTGIQGDTPGGAAVAMDLLATVLEPGSSVEVHQMTNPRQKDAFAYGSAFSRGAAVRMPGATWISFSGTAAIDEAGRSCHPGDFRAQMHMTLDIVEALIAQEGASLGDICNATLFLKQPESADECRRVLRERGLEALPGVPVVADVCRGDLLFEMDGTAAVLRG